MLGICPDTIWDCDEGMMCCSADKSHRIVEIVSVLSFDWVVSNSLLCVEHDLLLSEEWLAELD